MEYNYCSQRVTSLHGCRIKAKTVWEIISRYFRELPARPGIYGIRHRTEGLLYVGKTKSLRGRFSGGHKAFLWAWLDKYEDMDVRICISAHLLLGKPCAIIRARSCYFEGYRASLQRSNSTRKVTLCKPKLKNKSRRWMPGSF